MWLFNLLKVVACANNIIEKWMPPSEDRQQKTRRGAVREAQSCQSCHSGVKLLKWFHLYKILLFRMRVPVDGYTYELH